MIKSNTNWQPLTQLQVFVDLIEKMYCDTQAKITKLRLADNYTISDAELSTIMHMLHRQSENHNVLIEQLNIWQAQTKELEKLRLIENAIKRNEEVHLITIKCQQIVNDLIFKTVEMQHSSIAQSMKVVNKTNNYCKPHIQSNYNITNAQVLRYQQIRDSIGKLFPSFLSCMSKEAIDRSATRLELLRNKSLLINTEHEHNVFMDYCLHQYKFDNLNVMQRGFQQSAHCYEADMLSIFETASKAEFAYLDIIKPIGDDGIAVFNRLTNTEHLMIDKGANNIAKKKHYYTLVTHIMDFGDFLMTTGASVPVSIHTEEGLKVERRFKSFLNLQNVDINGKDYKQYVTDIYKLCFHEDITGDVDSPLVPFGEEALKARLNVSDTIH